MTYFAAAGVTATSVAAFEWSAVRVVRAVGQGFDQVYDDATTGGFHTPSVSQ